ncbi:MAG TPA: hypothetical protein VFU21_06010 [Kofleriaceae bacterium]|nr:hypothetical protein [Kofleriaceae bacterium]
MFLRTSLAVVVLLLALAGCDDKKKSADSPAAPSAETPPADTPPADTPPAAPAAADPAKVDEAANTALRIMAVVSSAVRGAKGDCARMKQNLTGVMTVAQKWRDQLAEQYKDPAVKEGVKAGLAAGKYPELRTNLDDTRSGAAACPDAAPDYEKVLAEIE